MPSIPRRIFAAPLLALSVVSGAASAVTPSPIPVSVVPPGTPFVTEVDLAFAVGTDVEKVGTFNVPAGQRFIIQEVGFYRINPNPVGSSVKMFLGIATKGTTVFFPFQSLSSASDPFPGMTVATHFSADPGSLIVISADRSDTSNFDQLKVEFSGYLVPGP